MYLGVVPADFEKLDCNGWMQVNESPTVGHQCAWGKKRKEKDTCREIKLGR